jgi:hypothetical protein
LFVAALQSTSFVVSPAEGEGAPDSPGPVHSGVLRYHVGPYGPGEWTGPEAYTVTEWQTRNRRGLTGAATAVVFEFRRLLGVPLA